MYNNVKIQSIINYYTIVPLIIHLSSTKEEVCNMFSRKRERFHYI